MAHFLSQNWLLDRRHVLRGFGVALALPLLDCMRPLRAADKQRGLLDTTLVIWAGEFGRTPMMQGNNGRNHNPYGFTIWMAGGGVNAGSVIGSTDDIGLRAAAISEESARHDPHRAWYQPR